MNIVLGILLFSVLCPNKSYAAIIKKRQAETEDTSENTIQDDLQSLEDILDSIETIAILGADSLSSFVETKKEVQNVSAKVYKTVNESSTLQNAIQSKMAFLQIIANLIEMAIRVKLDMGRAAICIITCLLQFDPERVLECKRKSNCVVPAPDS
ncbi:unnamed protein product [Lepeophtheirus salmonis]|uniref:(salmon louse) hypothetical protein n=1 Tax=Lepeophtheirus salmonis TaxID=72036 RepID=A0A0K2UBH7_LEPSM|nr:uncharacterized protein LOC121125521 [Lepeophtheirus salmonis]CAB4056494.1 unnamed protein product [Lepeophtheirus salmonis]CAF2799093.1 unnamed protein product [Lepeophtheirus salmonis]